MNRKLFRGFVTLTVLVTVIALGFFVPAVQAKASATNGRIEVRGVGRIEVRPDQAFIVLRLFALDDTAAEAQRRNADNLRAVQDVLHELGIDEEALRTRSITLREEWEYTRDQREFLGYLAEHILSVTIRDLDEVGTVLDNVIEASQASVQGVEFGLRDRRAAEREALREAYAHAVSRADVLADMAGIQLGLPSAIIDESAAVAAMPLTMDQSVLRAGLAFESATAVHPGTIQVEARVRLEFEY